MPQLGALIVACFKPLFNLLAVLVGVKNAIRVTAVMTLATIYISCVIYYTEQLYPLLSGVFNTAYGQLLGLLFPPISGSLLASLSAYWICVAGQKYVTKLTKMATTGAA